MDADQHRVTVQEAARALGVTEQAIRKRIKRGTLEADTEAGRVYVYLDAGYEPGQDAVTNPASDALISGMQARIESLEHQLEEANTRDRENRRLLAAALNARQIEAPEGEKNPEPEFAPDTGVSQDEPRTRSWWKKMFGRH